MKTFEDYEELLGLKEFMFMANIYVEMYDMFHPIDRHSLVIEKCGTLKNPMMRYQCQYAYKLRQDSSFDCRQETEESVEMEVSETETTYTFSPQQLCEKERSIFIAETGVLLECEKIENEVLSAMCQIRLVLQKKDADLCNQIDETQKESCLFFVQDKKSIAGCDGEYECFNSLDFFFPILSLETSSNDCPDEDAECVALHEKIMVDNGQDVACSTDECVEYLIEREFYINSSVDPEQLGVKVCSAYKDDESDFHECRNKIFNRYALENKNIKYCVWDDMGWDEGECFEELSDQLPADEKFCEELGKFSAKDTQEDIQKLCSALIAPKIALEKLDFSLCEELDWGEDDDCVDAIYAKLKETKNFDLLLCQNMEESYDEEECEDEIKSMKAISEKNLLACEDDSCAREIVLSDGFETTDCENGGEEWAQWCRDTLKMKEFPETYTVDECVSVENQYRCIGEYFGNSDMKNFKFGHCDVFDAEGKSYHDVNFHYQRGTTVSSGAFTLSDSTLKDFCCTQGVWAKEDISGCTHNSCVEMFLKYVIPTNINCSEVGNLHDLDAEKKQELVLICESALADRRGVFELDLAQCLSTDCVRDFMYNFSDGEYDTDFVKSLLISDETRSKIFLDSFDDEITDWGNYNDFPDVQLADIDYIKREVLDTLSAEDRVVIEQILDRRTKEYLLTACDNLAPDAVDFWDEPLIETCREDVNEYFE